MRTDMATKTGEDWHPARVMAELRIRCDLHFNELARALGYSESRISKVVNRKRSHPVQAAIAERLGERPQDIWPSRYHEDGTPRYAVRKVRPRTFRRNVRGSSAA